MKAIKELNLSYEQAEHYIRGHQCGICLSGLTLAWGGTWHIDDYVIRCAKDINHDTLARPYQPSPFTIPGYNLSQQSIKRRHQLEKQLEARHPGAGALMKYHGQVLTEVGAKEVVSRLWPEAMKTEVGQVAAWKAIRICVQYELNPLMKHVFLVPFDHFEGKGDQRRKVGMDWEVLLGIQANRLIAHRVRDFSYLDDTPRVMSEAEQIKIFGNVDPDSVVAITKLRDSQGNEAQGYGKWAKYKVYGDKRYDNEPKGTEKGNSQENQSFIRSERNAFDRLFAGKMPQGVGVMDEAYANVVEGEPAREIQIDKETGEVLEAKDVSDNSRGIASDPPKTEEKKSTVDMVVPKNLGELYEKASKLWKMTTAQVNKELNVSDKSEIVDLKVCWETLLSVKEPTAT